MEMQTPGVSKGHGSLACCSPRGRKVSDTTYWLNSNKEAQVSWLTLTLQSSHNHKKKKASIFACPTWHGNSASIYACICTLMHAKISKRFRMNWSGVQDFSKDLRREQQEPSFSQPKVSVQLLSKNKLPPFFCVPWVHFLAKLCKRMGRETYNAIVTIGFMIVITPQDFISKNNDFNATLSFSKR